MVLELQGSRDVIVNIDPASLVLDTTPKDDILQTLRSQGIKAEIASKPMMLVEEDEAGTITVAERIPLVRTQLDETDIPMLPRIDYVENGQTLSITPHLGTYKDKKYVTLLIDSRITKVIADPDNKGKQLQTIEKRFIAHPAPGKPVLILGDISEPIEPSGHYSRLVTRIAAWPIDNPAVKKQ